MEKKEMKYEFWKDWKRITKLEKSAIESLKEGKKLILNNIPKNQIIAIYSKGSLPRRELDKHSDVDLVVITKFTNTLRKIGELHKRYSRTLKPEVGFGGYSLWELRTGKRSNAKGLKKSRTGISRVLKHFERYKLIYGKPIDITNFPTRSHRHDLEVMIPFFRERFILSYQEKTRGGEGMGFREILKQVFWLIENEQRYLGNPTPNSWKGLNKSIKDPDHIMHLTYHYRQHPTKDKKFRTEYMRRLNSYLRQLEKKLK